MKKNYAFPWGIYIGDFMTDKKSFPVCVPANQGGFCVLSDSESQDIVNNFIENVALQLFNALPLGILCVDVFDFGHRKRFEFLSGIPNCYTISLNATQARSKFDELELLSQNRHHNLLSSLTPTLSEYNQQNSQFAEKYHLLIVNLEDFPYDAVGVRRITAFFDSPLTAGFYFIGFGQKSNLLNEKNENKALQFLLNRFSILNAKNKKIELNEAVFPLNELTKNFDFVFVNKNKSAIIQTLKEAEKNHLEENHLVILSTPIGKTENGRDDVNFVLSSENTNYHAFITGMTGTGKTTLLNNIILSVAENYTAQQLRLYLMDYKQGVEFGIFKNHPNCEKIFLDNEDTQAAIDLLEEFTGMIDARGKLFGENDVQDIQKYNDLFPDKPLHRIILIIDEVHRLFDPSKFNQTQEFSKLLTQVVTQGRSYGLHIILATQSLLNSNVNRAIMAQITLRLSFRLVDEFDSEKIFMMGNTEAVGLKQYQLIYNNNSGLKGANVLCRTNPERDIKAILSHIRLTRENNQMITPVIAQSSPAAPTAPPVSNAAPRVTPMKSNQTARDSELLNQFCSQLNLNNPNDEAKQ